MLNVRMFTMTMCQPNVLRADCVHAILLLDFGLLLFMYTEYEL